MTWLKKSLNITIASLLLLQGLFSPTLLLAQSSADFEFNSGFEVFYEQNANYVTVEQTLEIKVNNEDYYYEAQDQQTITLPDFAINRDPAEREFKRNSVKVRAGSGFDQPKEFLVEEIDNGLNVNVLGVPQIKRGVSYKIIVTYNTHELLNKNGNVLNFYLPGIAIDSKFEENKNGLQTIYRYEGALNIPPEIMNISYVRPSNYESKLVDGKTRISFDARERLGSTAWIQIGEKQYYYFRLEQTAPKTDSLTPEQISKITNLVSSNLYKITLPREFDEIDQQVYFKQLSPRPKKIERDEEGNISAYFEVAANKESQIVIEGYISMANSLERNQKALQSLDISMDQYHAQIKNEQNLSRYLAQGRFWETDSEVVSSTAQNLSRDQKTLKDLVFHNYRYIVDEFDYSEEKISQGNERVGAQAALQGAAAVCMEYADSLVALFRVQGVPARIAIGYGNDPTGAANEFSNTEAIQQKVGHQWLQIFVPEYGWLSVDPTWGESGRTYIGGDLDHILFYTFGGFEGDKYLTSLSSADSILNVNLETYKVYLQPLSQDRVPDLTSLESATDLQADLGDIELDRFELFFKTTTLGRSLVYVMPVCTVLIGLLLVLTVLLQLIKRNKKSKQQL